METTELAFTDLTPEERAEVEKAVAETEGVEVAPGALDFGATALIIIGTAAAVAAIAKITLDIIDRTRGGQVIDLTGEIPQFRRDRGLLYGLVTILLKDGKVSIEVHQPRDALNDLIEALAKIVVDLGKAGIEAATTAVEKVTGEKGTVTAEAAS